MSSSKILGNINSYLNKRIIISLTLTTMVSTTFTQNANPQSFLEDLKNKATSTYEEQKSRLNEEIDRQKERAREERERLENEIEKQKERARATYYEQKERVTEESRRFEERTKSSYREATEQIQRTTQDLQKRVEDYASNPENIQNLYNKYNATKKKINDVEITAIKHIPVYDTKTGKIQTLDSTMRNMVEEFGGSSLEGSDLKRDPIRTGFLMLMDTDYLLNSKIIQDYNGDWISINEASNLGFKSGLVESARKDYSSLKSATKSGDTVRISQSLERFSNTINRVNKSTTGVTKVTMINNYSSTRRTSKLVPMMEPFGSIIRNTKSLFRYELPRMLGNSEEYLEEEFGLDNNTAELIVKGSTYCIFPLALMLTFISLSERRKRKNTIMDINKNGNVPGYVNIARSIKPKEKCVQENPLDILKRRLIKGEIGIDEYDRIKKELII